MSMFNDRFEYKAVSQNILMQGITMI